MGVMKAQGTMVPWQAVLGWAAVAGATLAGTFLAFLTCVEYLRDHAGAAIPGTDLPSLLTGYLSVPGALVLSALLALRWPVAGGPINCGLSVFAVLILAAGGFGPIALVLMFSALGLCIGRPPPRRSAALVLAVPPLLTAGVLLATGSAAH